MSLFRCEKVLETLLFQVLEFWNVRFKSIEYLVMDRVKDSFPESKDSVSNFLFDFIREHPCILVKSWYFLEVHNVRTQLKEKVLNNFRYRKEVAPLFAYPSALDSFNCKDRNWVRCWCCSGIQRKCDLVILPKTKTARRKQARHSLIKRP